MFRLFRLTRTLFLLVIVALLTGAAACVVGAGRLLVDPRAFDPPAAADAIVVLSGARADRWLEAYELWREARAPRIVLSHGFRDSGMAELARRGIRVPSDADMAREILTRQLGVPAEAVLLMDREADNTAAEAAVTRDMAVRHGWTRVIVVTSVPHTRRTALAMRRVLAPAGVDMQIRGSRFDAFEPERWWATRNSQRWVLTELPKLAAYRLGMGE